MNTPSDRTSRIIARLSVAHERCCVPEFAPLHLTPETFDPVLHGICSGSKGTLRLATAGNSFEGRPIHSVSAGAGRTRVLLWSQMHGDESTATRALGDLFRHIAMSAEDPATTEMLSGVTLLALPMLNPDGAARCTRRSAQGIDMNRDALTLRTPEGRLLMESAAAFGPSVSFNLHDQELSTTGAGREITALALLAPAFVAARSDNPRRLQAKKIASFIAGIGGRMAPGRIAKYDDAFEPRAFGDTFQGKGYGTVLVESGHAKSDPDKLTIRRMNFVALLGGLEQIAAVAGSGGEIAGGTTDAYDALPPNGKRAYDIIVRNVEVRSTPGPYRADLGLSRQVDTHPEGPARLVDAGDLSIFTGLEEFDCTDASIDAGDLAFNQPFDYRCLTGG